ncbi:MAG: ABC transporter permease [Lachnospiraceae bacterium]|nr:ABC transporter permease [Lachnospiraceae bacterium]
MISKLSAWKYVKNNKKTVGVLATALALSFVAMYVMYVLLITTSESFGVIMLETPKKISYLDISDETLGVNRYDFTDENEFLTEYEKKRDELVEYLKNIDGIDDAFYTQILSSTYKAVMGEYGHEMPLMEPEKIESFLKHMDASFVSGKMPSKAGEVLIDETIMKNTGLKIGDWYQEKWFGETFRIVGTIKSKYLISTGVPNGYSNNGWGIVVYNNENTTDMVKILKDYGIKLGTKDRVVDKKEYKKDYKKSVTDTIDLVNNTIFIIVMTFLTILVIVAYISFMRNRVNEYCLYASIGYGRSDIYGMIIKEMGIIFAIGSVVGLALSLAIAFVIYKTVMEPMGLVSQVVYPNHILKIFATYVFVMGILQIPILINMIKIRTIDAIED